MEEFRVNIVDNNNYLVDAASLKKTLEIFFKTKCKERGEIELVLVSTSEMKRLAKIYLKENPPTLHNVLTFRDAEVLGEFKFPPDINSLGSIVICFEEAALEARKMNITVKERVEELGLHGAMHLLGFHHN